MTESKKFCFVLSPIGEEGTDIRDRADRFLKNIVRAALGSTFDIKRGDDELLTGTIIHQVIADISAADLVVVNLEGHNANVMYEVGIAHALSKPIIHMVPATESLKFDISGIRALPYHLDDTSKRILEIKRLYEMAHRNVAGPVDNPVTATLGNNSYAKRVERIAQLEKEREEERQRLKATTNELDVTKARLNEYLRASAKENRSVSIKKPTKERGGDGRPPQPNAKFVSRQPTVILKRPNITREPPASDSMLRRFYAETTKPALPVLKPPPPKPK